MPSRNLAFGVITLLVFPSACASELSGSELAGTSSAGGEQGIGNGTSVAAGGSTSSAGTVGVDSQLASGGSSGGSATTIGGVSAVGNVSSGGGVGAGGSVSISAGGSGGVGLGGGLNAGSNAASGINGNGGGINGNGGGSINSNAGAGSDMGSGGDMNTNGGASSGGQNGDGGAVATGGAGGSMTSNAASPSPGCGKGGRPSDGKVYVANESWLVFPDSYDGNTALPVLFGFHGCGSGNRGDASRTEYTDLTNGTAFASEYVVAVPISSDSGGCWNYNTDIVRVKQLYDDLLSNYCVDVDRVFATGHSSGAQFIVQILTGNHTADAEHLNFKGVAPVAASDYGAIASPTAVMYIQGKNDTVRGEDGKSTVDRFVAGNMCGSNSTAYSPMGAGCQSSGTTVDPGCISYGDCSLPTIWCSHNDPAYSNTSHGVPCFTAQATDEFFKSLD